MLHMCGWKHVTVVLAVMVCGMYQLDTVPGITNTASYLVIQQLSTFSFLFLSFNKPSDHQFKVVDYFLETASNVCKHSRLFPSSCLVSDPSYRGLNWGSFILCFQNNFLECEGSLCLMHCTIIKDILLIRKQVILMQFVISHHRICVLAGSLYYSLLANTIYNRQIYGATTIKNGRVIVWKVIMTVKAAGLRRIGR